MFEHGLNCSCNFNISAIATSENTQNGEQLEHSKNVENNIGTHPQDLISHFKQMINHKNQKTQQKKQTTNKNRLFSL